MTDRHDPETLLRQAAHLRLLVSMSKARRLIQRSQHLTSRYMNKATPLATVGTAPILKAELLHRLSLRPDGEPFTDSAEDIEAAELVEPTMVSLGALTLRVIDPDPRALAVSLGALDEGMQTSACWLVECEASAQPPSTGQYVVVPTGAAGVVLTFLVWLGHADLQELDAPEPVQGVIRNPALQGIGPRQALLVLESPEAE